MTPLQIDWFTFSAQVVNFLILVVLLHRFLYRPLVSAMERRRQEIERRLREGEEMKEQAQERADELEGRLAELEERREEELRRIEKEAGQRRSELMDHVRQEVEERRKRWCESLERERTAFLEELAERVAAQAVAVARRALANLADTDLERSVTARFSDRLEALEGDRRDQVVRAAVRADDDLVVRSAFELSEVERDRIREALAGLLPEVRTIRFETRDDMAFGVELTVGGLEIGWSLERYLGDLETEISALLDEETGTVRGREDPGGESGGGEEAL